MIFSEHWTYQTYQIGTSYRYKEYSDFFFIKYAVKFINIQKVIKKNPRCLSITSLTDVKEINIPCYNLSYGVCRETF